MQNAKNSKVRKYSTGMKQRLGIAIAIFHNPDFLILDEPLNGLDPAGVHDIREVMIRLKNEGKTIFFSSHILDEIEKVSSHIGILDKGNLLYQGKLSGLLSTITRKVFIRTNNPQQVVTVCNQHAIDADLIADNELVASVNNDEEYNQMITELVNNKLDIYSLETKENDLESVYLNLISK